MMNNKNMPYKLPEGFFEASRLEIRRRIRRQRIQRISLVVSSVAAALVVGLFAIFSLPEKQVSYDALCQQYVQSLTDEELSLIVEENEYDDFLTLNY